MKHKRHLMLFVKVQCSGKVNAKNLRIWLDDVLTKAMTN